MNAVGPIRSTYDAVIVGARCAGAATAMLLARAGLRVLVVDRGRYGTDTLSTHALMRGGVLQLRRWGLLDSVVAAGTPPVRTTSFHYGDESLEIAIKPRDGIDALYAPRRTVIDALLVDAARDAGAEVLHGVRAVDVITAEDGRVRGIVLEPKPGVPVRVAAGIVIGADGARSTVARLVGACGSRQGRHASGNVYGYWSGLELDGYHWYYRPGVGAGAIATNDGQSCVFASMPQSRFRDEIRLDLAAGYRRVIAECSPELAERLDGATLEGRLHGFAGEAGFMRRCQGPGWALVGDASYFKDPLTAHGMTDALRDAELLARAIARGTEQALVGYQALRDELSGGLFGVTDAVAAFDWDLEQVKRLHLELSREMNREVEFLVGLDEQPLTGPAHRGAQIVCAQP